MARPRRVPDWAVAAAAAALLVAVGAESPRAARGALGDLGPTVAFLAALLVLADGCRRAGLFEAVGAAMATGARGDPRRLLALVFAAAGRDDRGAEPRRDGGAADADRLRDGRAAARQPAAARLRVLASGQQRVAAAAGLEPHEPAGAAGERSLVPALRRADGPAVARGARDRVGCARARVPKRARARARHAGPRAGAGRAAALRGRGARRDARRLRHRLAHRPRSRLGRGRRRAGARAQDTLARARGAARSRAGVPALRARARRRGGGGEPARPRLGRGRARPGRHWAPGAARRRRRRRARGEPRQQPARDAHPAARHGGGRSRRRAGHARRRQRRPEPDLPARWRRCCGAGSCARTTSRPSSASSPGWARSPCRACWSRRPRRWVSRFSDARRRVDSRDHVGDLRRRGGVARPTRR